MPSDGPTQWTTTLREQGRLVVGPERTRLTLSLVVSGGILLVNGTRTIGQLSSDASWDFFASLRAVLAAGATAHEHQPSENGGFRVYLDPAGHPFCLVRG